MISPSHDRLGELCRPSVSRSRLALRATGSTGRWALTGCRRAGSLPPSDHGLLCARGACASDLSGTSRNRRYGHRDRRKVSKAVQRQRIGENDRLCRISRNVCGVIGICRASCPNRPYVPCVLYPALHGWSRSQRCSVTQRRHRPFCGSARIATVAPWLPLRNRGNGARQSMICTTMRVHPRVLVDERSALRRHGR